MKNIELHNRIVGIDQCRAGRVVAITNNRCRDDEAQWVYGHIVGFDHNSVGETILRVQTLPDQFVSVHPTNCVIFDN
jgi:hypothetical protein